MKLVALALSSLLVAASPGCDDGGDPPVSDGGDGEVDAGGGERDAGGGGDASGSSGCGAASPTGAIDGTIVVDGVTREYLLTVPASYDPARVYPLIFAWHGRTGTSGTARLYFGIDAEAGDDAVIVYPQGLPVSADPGDTGWELTENGIDVALFDALLAELQSAYCVGRVHSMGHSFGGYMSNSLACYRGGTAAGAVRAIAAIAGGGPFGACGGDPVSALIVHGTADQVVVFSQGEGSRDAWVAAAGCDAATVPIEPDPCVAYTGCDGDLAVRWCAHDETANAGHGWPSFAAGAAWQLFTDAP